ncbi:phage tail tip lysozyme [Allorhizobium ampelinum]|uniref:phage tail tip lysozyme n=1 Tax=Allorhizobium ampelinum TaxID=3025782 RepID=UPI000B3FBF2D|nr:phage tail tip lysozyme [Allorhizobium ampelinum]NTA27395.1 hypothetical protein [Allorhizobium ampelinum]OVE94450.1 hypothetical protein B7W85_12935 [Allorhizobium ampelinum]
MADTIKDFLISIGYGVDDRSERKFKESVRSATLQAELLSKAIVGAAKTVNEAMQSIAKNFDGLYWTAQRTGASVQNIRALSYAVSQLGGSYQGAMGAIEAFGQKLRTNPGYESLVKSLGVQTRDARGQLRDQITVMEDLGSKLKSMPYYMATQYANALGIDENTLRALQSGDLQKYIKQFEDTQKAVGLNSEKAAEASKQFMTQMRNVQATIEAVASKALTDYMPQITAFLEKFQKWVIDHGPQIIAAFTDIANAVGTVASDFASLIEKMTPVAQEFDRITQSLIGKDGLTTAIEILVGAQVLGKLIGMLGILVGAGGASGGGLLGGFVSKLAPLLAIGAAAYGGATAVTNPGSGLTNAPRLGRWGVDDVLRSGYQKAKQWFGGGASPAPAQNINTKQQSENALESYRFWREKGLPREAALAMVGNEEGESSFNPRAVGDGGRAGGIMQWHPDRRNAILSGTGIDVYGKGTTHRQQLEAAHYEMTKGNESHMWPLLMNAQSVDEATAAAVYKYERPRDKAGETAKRTALAYKWAKLQDAAKKGDGVPFNLAHPAFAGANSPLVGPTTSTSVNMKQDTHITVLGSSNPNETAGAVAGKQQSVNSLLLRNTQGAIR